MDLGDVTPSRTSPDGEPPSKRARTFDFAHAPREVGLMRSLPGDKFSSFIGSSSGIWFIRAVYGALNNTNQSPGSPIQTPEADIVPGEDDHLPQTSPNSSKSLWKDIEVTGHCDAHPSFQDLVLWSGSYFANWHPVYPFLHAPTILKLFEEIGQHGITPHLENQNLNMIIIRSIISISLADHRQDPSLCVSKIPTMLVFSSYDAAIDSIQVALSKPTSIQSLQATISVQLFLVAMLRMNVASRLGGLIIRMALQLGFHRCPNRFPSFSSTERELRQRIFWSLYCIDRLICQSMGLPLSLRDDDIDVCFPSTERHIAKQSVSDSRLVLLEFLARHSQIRGQIMELRNKSILHTQKEPTQAEVIVGKLGQWWNDVEEFIDSDAENASSMSAYHRTVLTVLYHENILSLNRPTLAASIKGPTFDVALQLCIGSSRAIITTLHRAITPLRHNEQSTGSLSLLWPSFTWAVWMSTFVLFHAAHLTQLAKATASRLAEKGLEILKHLSHRGSVWPDACAAAIRDLKNQLLPEASSPKKTSNTQLTSPALHPHQRLPISHQRPNQDSSSSIETATSHHLNHPTDGMTIQQQLIARRSAVQANVPGASPSTLISPGMPLDENLAGHTSLDVVEASHRDFREAHAGHGITAGHGGQNFETFDWNQHLPVPNEFGQDLPLSGDGEDLFAGFDIPFWIGQDQYSNMINDWN